MKNKKAYREQKGRASIGKWLKKYKQKSKADIT
jgi:hypothetical protein